MQHTQTLKQPKVFLLSIWTAMFERFGFYILADTLVLFSEKQLVMTDTKANTLYSLFNAFVFLTPALGGYLADNVYGIKRSMIFGLLLEGLGLLFLALPNPDLFYPALALVILGVGFFKTAPTHLMARSYTENDPRIDSGFTLYYMFMNLGSILSGVLAGFFQKQFGWHVAFSFGSIGLFISLVVFLILRSRADSLEVEIAKVKMSMKKWLQLLFAILVGVSLFAYLLYRPVLAQMFFYSAAIAVAFYFLFEIVRSPKHEKLQIMACLALILTGMVFFIMYFQLYTSMTLFMERCMRHMVFGIDVPTIAWLSLNPFWVVLCAPVLVHFYKKLGSKGNDLAITVKFALGLMLVSLCFLVLGVGTLFPDSSYHVSYGWVVLSVFLYSVGELLISALGVAMVTHIAPKRMYGVMMGSWFLIAASIGSTLSGRIADLAAIPATLTDPASILGVYGHTFNQIGIGGILFALFSFAVGPYINKFANVK